jgi:hypothetical protein
VIALGNACGLYTLVVYLAVLALAISRETENLKALARCVVAVLKGRTAAAVRARSLCCCPANVKLVLVLEGACNQVKLNGTTSVLF